MKHIKHPELDYSSRNLPGYNAPNPDKKKTKGGVPCNQPFHQPAKRKAK